MRQPHDYIDLTAELIDLADQFKAISDDRRKECRRLLSSARQMARNAMHPELGKSPTAISIQRNIDTLQRAVENLDALDMFRVTAGSNYLIPAARLIVDESEEEDYETLYDEEEE